MLDLFLNSIKIKEMDIHMNTKIDKNTLKSFEARRVQDFTIEDLSIKELFNIALSKTYSQGEIGHLLKNSPTEFLKEHIEYMIIENQNVAIEDVPSIFLEDYNIAVFYAQESTSSMALLPTHYRDDEDFILEVAFNSGTILRYATERVKNIERILNVALKNTKKAFQYFPEKFKTKENCLIALAGRFPSPAYNWEYIPKSLSLNESFIKEASEVCPQIYAYLDNEIKNRRDMIDLFLTKDSANIRYLSDENKNNPDIVRPIVEQEPLFFKFLGDELKNNADFVFPLLKNYPQNIHECGESIKSNIEIAKHLCNIRIPYPAISFFNESIKENITTALISILRAPETMKYISDDLKGDKKFINLFIEQANFNHIALEYISQELKNDKEIMLKAYDKEASSLNYIGKELRLDKEFLKHIFSGTYQNKNLSQYYLLKNLESLNVVSGEESILLSFCDNTGMDIDDIQIKADILRQIKNPDLIKELQKQTNTYSYIKSLSLKNKLDKDLSRKEVERKKVKI